MQSRDSFNKVLWSQPQPQASADKTCLSDELVWSLLPQTQIFQFLRCLEGFFPSLCWLWGFYWLCKESLTTLGTPYIYGWMFQWLSHPGVRWENEAQTWKNSWADKTDEWEEKRVHPGPLPQDVPQGTELMIRAEIMEKVFVSQPIESFQKLLLSEDNRGL